MGRTRVRGRHRNEWQLTRKDRLSYIDVNIAARTGTSESELPYR